MATGPEHYVEAERLRAAADEWADADTGWKAELTAQERINQRLADLTDALVHATLAQAAATALAARPEGMYDLDYEAWDRIAGVQDDDHDDEVEDEDDEANADPDLIGAMARHTSTHGTAAVYDLADPHDAALAEQARAEHVDYAEAAAVREIEREMDRDAGDDSEIDRQVAEDDALNEREYEAHEASEAWLDAHPDEVEPEDAETGDGYTGEQLNGNACSVCGGGFKAGEASEPSGYVLDRGQLFAHTACLAESEA